MKVGHKKTLGDSGYVYYLDGGNGISGALDSYVHQIVYTKYVLFFVGPLCFNKSVLKN